MARELPLGQTCRTVPVRGRRNACNPYNLYNGLQQQLYYLLVLLTLLIMSASCQSLNHGAKCKVDACTRIYNDAMDVNGLTAPEPSPAFCRVLREYGTCIRSTARHCRGNLGYHSTSTLVHHVTAEFNCSQLLAAGNPVAAGTLPIPRSSVAPPVAEEPNVIFNETATRHHHHKCTFQGRHKFRHCGLFGDPHLKTFDNEYQTCRVRGAWPLIDNPYLAVQVTNEPVVDGSPATATTKVTIIIRGRATPCTGEKTYEAQADVQGLPSLFIDGTQRSGPDESVTLTVHDQGSRVEIFLRYIETTLVVRQVGRYLAFSARMPEELVQTRPYGQDPNTDSLQLCVRGCPVSERLDPVAARGHALPWLAAVARCRKSDGYSNDINNNLTDHYLDWCVFDVMTTGDGAAADDFTAAAHSAQADVYRFDRAALRNRTTTPEHPEMYNSASIQRTDVSRTLALLLLLMLATIRV